MKAYKFLILSLFTCSFNVKATLNPARFCKSIVQIKKVPKRVQSSHRSYNQSSFSLEPTWEAAKRDLFNENLNPYHRIRLAYFLIDEFPPNSSQFIYYQKIIQEILEDPENQAIKQVLNYVKDNNLAFLQSEYFRKLYFDEVLDDIASTSFRYVKKERKGFVPNYETMSLDGLEKIKELKKSFEEIKRFLTQIQNGTADISRSNEISQLIAQFKEVPSNAKNLKYNKRLYLFLKEISSETTKDEIDFYIRFTDTSIIAFEKFLRPYEYLDTAPQARVTFKGNLFKILSDFFKKESDAIESFTRFRDWIIRQSKRDYIISLWKNALEKVAGLTEFVQKLIFGNIRGDFIRACFQSLLHIRIAPSKTMVI